MQKGWRIQNSKRGRPTRRDSAAIIASIWRVGNRCANYKRRRQLPRKAHLPTVCTPACPSCCDPALPTQITSHRTESSGSSAMSSTIWPRLTKVTSQPKAVLRPIDNETGKHFLAPTSVDDEVGSLLRSDPLGSAASGDRAAQHCFRLKNKSSSVLGPKSLQNLSAYCFFAFFRFME